MRRVPGLAMALAVVWAGPACRSQERPSPSRHGAEAAVPGSSATEGSSSRRSGAAPAAAPSTPAETTGDGLAVPTEARAEHLQLAAALRKGLPAGSADYAEVLAAVMLHHRGKLAFEALRAALVARALRPHPAGDAYLLAPSPKPPAGTPFDPAVMPEDWAGTWGEVAMAYHLGELTRAQYDRLHAAAHPSCGAP